MEIWKDVPGWLGFYQVSSLGRVRSLPRVIDWVDKGFKRKRPLSGKVLKQQLSNRGYPKVSLTRPGNRTQPLTHDLVMLAFAGKKPKRLQVCHFNDDKLDNRYTNLRYDTAKANCADRKRNGKYR